MSRSYRKAIKTDGYGTKFKRWMKKYSNKKVRKYPICADGKFYRKILDPWMICDYIIPYEWWSKNDKDWNEHHEMYYRRAKRK